MLTIERGKALDNEIMRAMAIPIRTEQMLHGKGLIVVQWIAEDPTVAGYEFLAEYIAMRIKAMRSNV